MSEAEHLTRVALDARSAYWTALGDLPRAAAAPSEDSLAAWRYAAAVAATLHESPPPADRDPRDGHEWHVVVYARGASSVRHSDHTFSGYVDGPLALTVQANSLPDALRAAADAPFADWWRRQEEIADAEDPGGPA